jgi:hypothetical protein
MPGQKPGIGALGARVTHVWTTCDTRACGKVAIETMPRRPLCARPMSGHEHYTIVFGRDRKRAPLKPWAWEIYRDGKPLPIPLRREGFKSEHTAKLAGTVALREFLSALTREQAKPD